MSKFPFILSLMLTAGGLLPGAAGAEVTFAADNLNMSGNRINNLGMAASPADGDAANVGFVNTGLATKADTGHNHDSRYYTQAQVDAMIAASNARIAALETDNSDLKSRLSALETLLAHFTRDGDQIVITGANLHVRSGAGSTAAEPNGLGNVIIGYNEVRGLGDLSCSLGQYDNETDCTGNGGVWALNHKSGSHNLVVGMRHNYSRYGGLVVGFTNTISGDYSTVSGGFTNTASGYSSAISGGFINTASGYSSAVSGGAYNTANGYYSAVSGGYQRSVSGSYDWRAGALFEDF